MIDRIRLTAAAKNQLSTLKRRTGIEHYNSICRHALCLSLSHSSMPPNEDLNFAGGIEIDWRILTGGYEDLYTNLVICSMCCEDVQEVEVKDLLVRHIHRGLSLMVSRDNDLVPL